VDVLTFLAAWGVFDSTELGQRLKETSARERVFVESQMCRFDTRLFHQIGSHLKRSLLEPDYRSSFLTGTAPKKGGWKPILPTPEPTLTRLSAGIVQ
jgi:hypothetical protein